MVKLSRCTALIGLRDKWRRMLHKRRALVELAAYPPRGLARALNAVVSVDDPWIVTAAHPRPGEPLPLRLKLLPPAMTSEPPRPYGRLQPIAWPMFHRVERRAVRMHDMMARLRVDPGKLARVRRGDAYAEARARCLTCAMTDECLRWLGDPGQVGRGPEFCPNLALFAACQRDRAAS
jgi:hypothetical protein